MPYTVKKSSGKRPWKILDAGGNVVGSSLSKEKALASTRARYAAESGAPMGKKRKKR